MGLKDKSYKYSCSHNVCHNAFHFPSFILISVIHRIGLFDELGSLHTSNLLGVGYKVGNNANIAHVSL